MSSEGSCVPLWGVLPLLQALGAGLTGLSLGNLEGRADVTEEEEPSG